MKSRIALVVSCLLLFSYMAMGQQEIIKIWHGKVPNAIYNASYQEDTIYIKGKSPRISHVTCPTLTFYRATKGVIASSAVIICPGGGYGRLAMDIEGSMVAGWFNSIGISAFVLKYRLPSDLIMIDKSIGPLQDAQEAVRIVRRNASAWGIDPAKIGIMGFSAGGHLASTLSTHYNEKVYEVSDEVSGRPDFSILIYPVISMDTAITHRGSRDALLGKSPSQDKITHFSNELQVTSDTPPGFLVHATDDTTVPVQNSINYLLAMKKRNVLCELHMYEKGGHGFGLGKTLGTASTWPEACKKWLIARGLL